MLAGRSFAPDKGGFPALSDGVRLLRLVLQNFRNIPLAQLELGGPQTFFWGANGQGKTNLLEAIGFVTALRSFRAAEIKPLIRHGEAEAGLRLEFEREEMGETTVAIRLRPRGKEAQIDGAKVSRLGEFIGRFPTVLFASDDLQLIRGGPGLRRRFLDLVLAATDLEYLRALQGYHRALQARNSLLKADGSPAELEAFEGQLAPAAAVLVAKRKLAAAEIGADLGHFYRSLAKEDAEPNLLFEPDLPIDGAAAFAEALARNRPRDLRAGATQRGPHRDDFQLQLGGRDGALYASEGQQRALTLALRFAEARLCRRRLAVGPLILADDVLGELDPERRRRFWETLDPDLQLFATGTEKPEPGPRGTWKIFRAEAGAFHELSTA
jgi:DNA replication and repair protein RecF